MKKFISLLIIIIMSFSACGEEKKDIGTETQGYNADINNAYGVNGTKDEKVFIRVVATMFFDGEDDTYCSFEYDDKGNIYKYSVYTDGDLSDIVDYEFTEDGMPLFMGVRDIDDYETYMDFGSLENNVQKYEYWGVSRRGKEKMSEGIYEYDDKGRIIKTTYNDAHDEDLESYTKFYYDSEDRLYEIECYESSFADDGYDLAQIKTFSYDDAGKLISVINSDGSQKSIRYGNESRAVVSNNPSADAFEYKGIYVDADYFIKIQNQQIIRFAVLL